ncbi:MAG: LON peptidase substrate-binding domain-containing protein [Fimbriimonadaceae bacterium]
MAERLQELPLFLLQTVLFPYAHIQLHVFEDRYVQMVRNCIEKDLPFGVVLIRSGQEVGGYADPYMVGTTVQIKEVLELGNGLMDIQIRGEQRFRIRRIDESKPYLVGHVEPVFEVDTEDEPRTDALVMRCREDFHSWIAQLVTKQGFNIQIRFPEDITALSYAIANMLPIDNLEKQRLLELTNTMERVSSLIALLEQELVNGATTIGLQRLNSEHLKEWISKN